MSSLARRTLRTTVAAAGMAALGVGLAGNAVAAPADAGSAAPGNGSALPGFANLPTGNPLAELPSAPSAPALPMLFVFEGPKVNMSASDGSAVPGPDRLALPVAAPGAPAAQATPAPAPRPAPAPAQSAPAPQVGALSALDSGAMFDEFTEQRLVDQQGLDVTSLDLGTLN